MHRYRVSRPWAVAALAGAAAWITVLLSWGISAALPARTAPAVVAGPDTADPRGVRAAAAPQPASEISPGEAAPPPLARSWRLQVGAFRSREAAERHLRSLIEDVPQAAGLVPAPEPFGQFVRARLVGSPDEAGARSLCALIVEKGGDCFVVPPG